MSAPTEAALAIHYEHPHWFRPLFAELDRRGTPWTKARAGEAPGGAASALRCAVLFNRMSPSAWLRGHARELLATGDLLEAAERRGVRVVNGSAAWRTEISKARQIELFERLGLPFPRTRVIRDPREAAAAAEGLPFPVVVKPNVGGSGAGIRRFDRPETLRRAAEDGALDLGIDGTGLVQELVPAEEGRIVRVEVLDGRYLYAIRVYSDGEGFDLCPADVCRSVDGAELERAACAADAPRNGLRVEGYAPPADVVSDVERVTAEAGIEVGGVEYLVDARDGGLRYYDVNALSNFVADAPRVVGFDPFVRLADWLERELEAARAAGRPHAAAAPSGRRADEEVA